MSICPGRALALAANSWMVRSVTEGCATTNNGTITTLLMKAKSFSTS